MKLFGCLRSPLFGSTGGFRVSLDRVGDEPIGMVATYCPSAPQSQGLVIRDVTADEGSAILRWNQRHPKRQVRPGLAILEVNGCCSTAEMLREVKDSNCLELLLCEHLTPLQSEILSSSRRRSKAIAAVEAVIQEIEVDTEVTEQCAICYEDLTMQVIQLPCGHCFHKSCATKWLASCKAHQRCPLCNQKLEIYT
ncbi:E3 ubiquitin-protein ligase RNF139 (RING finger protein 139) (RING-type E3 ubiquitin transferase RNF139) (Translocation in renal carcinoma on chromosome 8 protein) [Durusdinium trenchii]|uniref:E3 ubiquitin-protein ligase RNF139 (RING finger protein 139) (RING-type E3 ubiquitin transferase RNF139) (Translocation in renal carcinoma on chromosome 8 protein) n=1 Tax=Durusdinium trenchii TaxID=1381693 RepID=A0ABP0NS50_9DINO